MSTQRRTNRIKSFCACHGSDLDAHIREIVDRAPPLTEAQKATLYAIMRPGLEQIRRERRAASERAGEP